MLQAGFNKGAVPFETNGYHILDLSVKIED